MIRTWVESRNKYYVDLLLYFLERPSKLLILDVDEDKWIQFLCDFFGLEYYEVWDNKSKLDGDLYANRWPDKRDDDVIPEQYLDRIKNTIYDVYEDLNITDGTSSLLVRSLSNDRDYMKIYKDLSVIKNNLKLGQFDG